MKTVTIDRQITIPTRIPESLRTCPQAPAVPGQENTQRTVAEYVVGLHEAHRICRSHLRAVDRILDEQEATAEKAARDRKP